MASEAGHKEDGRRTAAAAGGWIVGLMAAVVPVVAIIGVVAFVFTYVTVAVPAPGDIKQNQVATIVDAKGGVIARVVPPEGNRTDVKYEQIPTSMVAAIKAAEDRDFDSNVGFSLSGFSRAALGKLKNDGGAGGGSTITQQYVKNAIVGDEVSYKRKFKELAIATKMSRQWSKEEIMAAYLNTIYFGRGAYGIAAAAKTYFNRDITKVAPEQCANAKLPRAKRINCLTTSESALLAAVIRGPSIYDPAVNPEMATNRWNYVLDGMVDIGYLSGPDRDTQKFPRVARVKEGAKDTEEGPSGLVRRQVLAELDKLGISENDVQTGGLTITTSIQPQVQQALVEQARAQMSGEPKDLRTGSVSIDPATGGVAGYYGGEDGQGWDYASAGLQTGSVFKVFALVAALEQDIPLSQRYSSDPYAGPGGLTITNSEGMSCGTCNLATAAKLSLNTVFYRLMMDLNGGPQAIADTAHRLGIAESYGDVKQTLAEANGKPENGIVLGQYASRVIDMASAYATLAASGIYRQPYFVEKVENSAGDVLFQRESNKGKRVVSEAVADNVTAALEPIAAYSNGNALSDPVYGPRPSAAKTGTAQLGDTGMNKDAWMVGYTPQLSTAVWVGTNNGTALRNYSGGSIYGSGLPAQIWRAQMNAALEGQPIEQFPSPEPVGGQAGVPYEPPPVTAKETETTRERPSRTPRIPSRGDNGDITLAPGVTIPFGNGGQNNGGGQNSGDGTGNGRGGGASGGDDDGPGNSGGGASGNGR